MYAVYKTGQADSFLQAIFANEYDAYDFMHLKGIVDEGGYMVKILHPTDLSQLEWDDS